ncbi:hypothetical protein CUJ86_00725 [Methanofollis fontis]|uniref:PKD domain-containing protein n=1 Tax=Methanofollis fontis TaxID=2052832 RepID=A0A483CSI7_9EURY|nr:hypothetical protein CUJ86_00725 [Methanofollis fontis]
MTLKVMASDPKGNRDTVEKLIEVSPVGFSRPYPTGASNVQPVQISAFAQQINPATFTMTLYGAQTIPLDFDYIEGYVVNMTPPAMADGVWYVNVTGTDLLLPPSDRYLNWSFTIDTVPPVINAFAIAGTDGDDYVEAEETLNFNWNVAGADTVRLMDNDTQEIFFTSTDAVGAGSVSISVGNRNMVFAALDEAENVAYVPFHLYYNYMAWINSTKMGTISGIDTNFTAMRQLDLTAQGSVTLYNAREVPFPTLGDIARSVTHVGQVTNDTYVDVDDTANATYTGADTYDNIWTYNPGSVLNFQVQAPYIDGANLLILEANESYLAQMANEGKSAEGDVDYNKLIQQNAWFFINGGYCKYTVNDIGTLSEVPGTQQGNAITIPASGKIMDTLALSANQVNLSTGYRLSTQALPDLVFPAGDYIIAAISVDDDRIGFVEAMPFTVMNTNEVGTVPASVNRGTDFDASFTTSARRVSAVVLRDATWDATVGIDASALNVDMIRANLTYDGIPATKKLYGNIYASPDAAGYAVASNTTTVSVPTDGLLAGTYGVYLVAEHVNGTVQAFGVHQIQVRTPGAPVADFNMTPTTGFAPLAVTFADESTGNINTWAWEFGDGTTSTVQNPPTHTYAAPGTYLVNLTVTGFGGSDTTQQTLVVTSPVPAAVFTATPTTGTAPLTVTFTDLSTGNITAWAWDFGDGATSIEQNPTHVYVNAGTYVANLTVTGPLGNDSAVATITVNAPSGGGGGGGSSVTTSTSTGSAEILTASWGGVLKPYMVYSQEKRADLYLNTGVTALDADGNALKEIEISELDDVPAVPSGVSFAFLGYAVECSPAGATFAPAIDLTFNLSDEEWATALAEAGGNPDNLVVKWYNPTTQVWENVPTVVDAATHTVTASITHFSTYGLFTDAAVVTPVTQEPTTPSTTVPPVTTVPSTTAAPSGEGGLPMTWIILVIVIVVVAAGAYLYMQRR